MPDELTGAFEVSDAYCVRMFAIKRDWEGLPMIVGLNSSQEIIRGVNVSKCAATLEPGAKEKSHDSPDKECTCGFYSYDNPKHWWRESFHKDGLPEIDLIKAVVKVSGQVIIQDYGVRSENIELVAVTHHPRQRGIKELKEHFQDVQFFTNTREMLDKFPLRQFERGGEENKTHIRPTRFFNFPTPKTRLNEKIGLNLPWFALIFIAACLIVPNLYTGLFDIYSGLFPILYILATFSFLGTVFLTRRTMARGNLVKRFISCGTAFGLLASVDVVEYRNFFIKEYIEKKEPFDIDLETATFFSGLGELLLYNLPQSLFMGMVFMWLTVMFLVPIIGAILFMPIVTRVFVRRSSDPEKLAKKVPLLLYGALVTPPRIRHKGQLLEGKEAREAA